MRKLVIFWGVPDYESVSINLITKYHTFFFSATLLYV
jgi:hypothetical protein